MKKLPEKSTRDRILDAANTLFYNEGIRAVSVDAVAEKAGITKKTLYYHFKSKDELIAGYLTSRDQPNLATFSKWFDEAEGDVADKTAAIFLQVAENARHPKWRGCGFIRTAAELASMPGHPAVVVGANHKKKFEAWLAERYLNEGVQEPEVLARRVVLLMEGAFSTMLIQRDPSYAQAAADTARGIIDVQRKK